MSKSSLSRKIAKATTINHQIKILEAELDELKADIRSEAVAAGLGPVSDPIEFDCRLGVCTVSFVSPTMAIAKGVDVRDLMHLNFFSDVFVERVVFDVHENAKKFYETELNVSQRITIEKYIQFKHPAARVTLPKLA